MNTNAGTVAIAALTDRYASPDRRAPKVLTRKFKSIDAELRRAEGPDAPESHELTSRYCLYANAERQIQRRRIAANPEAAFGIKDSLDLDWNDYEQLLDEPAFIPKMDTTGHALALELAEHARLSGGLLFRQPDGTVGGPSKLLSTSIGHILDDAHVNLLREQIKEQVVSASREPLISERELDRVAEQITDTALLTCGIYRGWAQGISQTLLDSQTTLRRVNGIDRATSKSAEIPHTVQSYNALRRVEKALDAILPGAENILTVWLNMMTELPHCHELLQARSPSEIAANIQTHLDIDRAAWRALHRMDPALLEGLIEDQKKPLHKKKNLLKSALERRARSGRSKYRSANKLLDKIFAISKMDAFGTSRPPDHFRMTNLIVEFIKQSNMTAKERGCSHVCLGQTMTDLIDFHLVRLQSLGSAHIVPKMNWHEYIANMRAFLKRRGQMTVRKLPRPRVPSTYTPLREYGYSLTEILRAEDATLTNIYPVLRAPSGDSAKLADLLSSAAYAAFELTSDDRTLTEEQRQAALVIAVDRHGHGKWQIDSVSPSYPAIQPGPNVLDALLKRLTRQLRLSAKEDRKAMRQQAARATATGAATTMKETTP